MATTSRSSSGTTCGPGRPVVLLLARPPADLRAPGTASLPQAGRRRAVAVVCPDLPGYGRSGKPEPTPDHHAARQDVGCTAPAAAR